MNELQQWKESLKVSLENNALIKITLSKPHKSSELQNIYAKVALIKNVPKLSFTYHYKTKDVVKNLSLEEALVVVDNMMQNEFKIATLFTIQEDLILRVSKKGKAAIQSMKPTMTQAPDTAHDNQKKKRAVATSTYLELLGVTDSAGQIIPRMADKYKQINKYLEVMEDLIKSANLPDHISIADMGAGKGYLTFALYDYMTNKLNLNVTVTGVELRKDLVDQCNTIAQQCGFDQLHFEESTIEDFELKKVDILIALHACDTATDDAIAKGIAADAALIVCAPCCHKQIRQQLKGKEHTNPILKYGIFKEREFEMVTDTIRALVLERNSYKSNIFEFISSEHTGKNTMLVGVKSNRATDSKSIDDKINSLKANYQIDYHYLEKLI
ncbi:MAG TPA: SAM-dependent methyltransferase [Cytophagales bacterium]|nr:SAM-dependent methyltransferase [Cytophagales bacterium]HCR53716.1 SAM-dependent methyltransferase [Cytophagales bacterium]